ncbi:SDR family NAD(P)-dependent oxidoreductase [Rhizobium sp. 3T7]|uniref:SDR family NAD(P)-dependent oxidoreductase n=1 Tax=Rhizobium sp. 3T7 TaxID=2874922 RepID=UPI001CCDAB80|nr:SDR family NAD(P)-dependent oxidoreductase [Rhizobium sp. 3T7]
MSKTEKPLAGKVALVSGGSRGIGAAIVRRLTQDGAMVAFSYAASTDRAENLVKEIEAAGGKAIAFKADQALPGEVVSLVRKVHAAFGRLDILVNSAASSSPDWLAMRAQTSPPSIARLTSMLRASSPIGSRQSRPELICGRSFPNFL